MIYITTVFQTPYIMFEILSVGNEHKVFDYTGYHNKSALSVESIIHHTADANES